VALSATDHVGADGTGSAGVRIFAFVLVDAAIERVTYEAFRTRAGVVSGRVETKSILSAGVGLSAFVDIETLNFSVSFESCVTFAKEMGWQVATPRVFHAPPRYRGILAFVNILAVEAVAPVPGVASAREAAQGVGAVGEDVARPVFALVLVWNFTVASSISVVAMALAVQASAILTGGSILFVTIICTLEFVG
jgi:hypothetical protein